MSYTVLARRYRSTTFDEVIGQEHVAQTLKKAIAADRIAHAYLFTGTRGVGKTSMARILAKALNCLSFEAATPTPCGTCDSCQRVAKGDDMDVIEIDAASNTGVDNVRDIIENAQYRPSRSRYKVYIIDEVHMLSKAAFNALLKTMEEPPGHVKFILATTEVEKVLPTILSRCQRYDFRNIPTREIAAHLREVSKQEKIDAHDDALLLVAKAGAGSMRDALSLLDRLLSVGEHELTTDLIESMLGLPKSQQLFDLAGAVGDGDIKAVLTRAAGMINAGQSVDGLIAALTDHLRNLLILRTCGRDSELVEVPGLALDDLVAQAERFDPAALVQDVAVLEELRRHVRQSQAGRALLDATLVRMAMADQFASIGELVARVGGGGGGNGSAGGVGQKKKSPELTPPAGAESSAMPPAAARAVVREAFTAPPAVSGPPASAPPPVEAEPSTLPTPPVAPAPAVSAPVIVTSSVPVPSASVLDDIDFGDDDLPRPGKVWEDEGPSLSEMVRGSIAPAAAPAGPVGPADATPPPSTEIDVRTVWARTLEALKPQGGVYGIASQSRLDRIGDDGVAVIRMAPSVETFVKVWDKNGKKDIVRDALSRALGRDVGVRFEVDDAPPAPAPNDGFGSGGGNASAGPSRGGPPAPAGGSRGLGRPAPNAAPPPPPPAAAQRVTPEQVDAIRKESPLVEALVQQFNAQIVKVESDIAP